MDLMESTFKYGRTRLDDYRPIEPQRRIGLQYLEDSVGS